MPGDDGRLLAPDRRALDGTPAGPRRRHGHLVLAVFAAVAVPIDLGGADDGGGDPTSMSTRRAYDLLSTEFFPGS
ncbi:hypothetical protein Ga0074812_106315 [Parafrankia irregularis]|uniref:Uncharacterized protein n=1 Tax=Parafrankia irregularis TaxID=795642 RepID=A0A0S4QMH7_9ACTN|nr:MULTISPECIES: hypothetical protein [Parafrankia]MBE3202307.1 hypothetical protein [Parafrankia sp. CH37]CUU56060.1 hypothetical protein Ga0074812_106315 [Parafrankia irregularis]